MSNRIHFQNPEEATKVQKLLNLHGYYAYILKSGCIYEGGSILEFGEQVFELVTKVIEAFDMVASVEY